MLEKTHGEDEEKSLDLFVVGFGFLVIMGGLWFLPELGLEANETIILRTESGRLLEAYEDGGIGYSPPPPKAANFVTKIVKKKGLLNRVMLKTYYGHFLTYDRKLKGYATMDRPSLTEVFDDNEALLFSESRYGHIFHPWEKEKREKGNDSVDVGTSSSKSKELGGFRATQVDASKTHKGDYRAGKDSSDVLADVSRLVGNLLIEKTSMEHLDDFALLREVTGNVVIRKNPFLKDMRGLRRLERIGGDLLVEDNGQLRDFKELEKLKVLEGKLRVSGHPVLSSFAGLRQVDGVQGASVFGNYGLDDCETGKPSGGAGNAPFVQEDKLPGARWSVFAQGCRSPSVDGIRYPANGVISSGIPVLGKGVWVETDLFERVGPRFRSSSKSGQGYGPKKMGRFLSALLEEAQAPIKPSFSDLESDELPMDKEEVWVPFKRSANGSKSKKGQKSGKSPPKTEGNPKSKSDVQCKDVQSSRSLEGKSVEQLCYKKKLVNKKRKSATFFYVLESLNHSGRRHFGLSSNPGRGLAKHNSGLYRNTKSSRPWKLVYSIRFEKPEQAKKFVGLMLKGHGGGLSKDIIQGGRTLAR